MTERLTDMEKAYFDTIKQVATGTRPKDLQLWRMTLDGKDVAVVVQRMLSRETAEEVGFHPLAVILDDETAGRLRTPSGESGRSFDPGDVEGAG